ncbi:MAG: amino acid ABC transporter permease [Proteobacteria bacterium]|nr:amino acid ABC transporter permease [Pseudomonadota bacterium]MBU1583931.1 amino acid ABC transporter permease [Pseudomonadota bacterium]MBU2454321.1 amino acid ABC transporter permease [Pseudomonadota bacterium]
MLNKPSYKFTLIDMAVILFLITVIYLFFSRMSHFLDYKWEWEAIPSYFFFLDAVTGKIKANIFIKGFITTVKLSVWSTLLGFLMGTVSGIMGAKGSFEQRFVSRIYVETIRNIPSLVLVIIFYYFISSQFLDALYLDRWLRGTSNTIQQITRFLFAGPDQINSFISAVMALGIYEGAYVSEIVRGGIISVPDGQWEASWSIGLSRQKTFLLVILPQTFRRVAFPLAGQFISTIKDSAIVSVISVQELTFQGMELMSATFLTFEIWITITVLYFILTFSLSRSVAFLERKYALKQ